MMSAEETRQYQQKIYDDRAEQELTEIEAKIGAAIMGGNIRVDNEPMYVWQEREESNE